MGIVSITPRIDYSQGNDWSVNLLTLDDLHKPQLDEIGFQDLLFDLMSASTTQTDIDFMPEFTSIGKVPAWLNYMTNSYRDWETDRKSTRLNSSHRSLSRMPSSA